MRLAEPIRRGRSLLAFSSFAVAQPLLDMLACFALLRRFALTLSLAPTLFVFVFFPTPGSLHCFPSSRLATQPDRRSEPSRGFQRLPTPRSGRSTCTEPGRAAALARLVQPCSDDTFHVNIDLQPGGA